MTALQKIIIGKLIEGHTIAAVGPGQIRLRDESGNPVLKISGNTFYVLKRDYLRKKKGLFLMDLRKVRSMHGNAFAKKFYKGKAAAPVQNTPPLKRNKSGPSPDQPTLF